MGTRNLTIVVHEGKYKIAKYCQWDGYPSGQGETISKFLREDYNRERFLANLARIQVLTESEMQDRWTSAGAVRGSEMVSLNVSKVFKDKYPQLSRDMGGDILEWLQSRSPQETIEMSPPSLDFAADSLFCEWAYVVDIDNDLLEVYKGFNTKHKLTEADRFYFLQKEGEKSVSGNVYWPVRKIAEFTFTDLTASTMTDLGKKQNEED